MSIFDDILNAVTGVVNTVNAVKDAIASRVGTEAGRVIGDIKSKVDDAKERLQDFLRGIEDRVKFAVGNVQTRLGQGIDDATSRIQGFVSGIKSDLSSALGGVKDWITARVADAKNALSNAVEFVRTNIIAKVGEATNALLTNLGQKANDLYQQVLDTGKGIVTNLYSVATQISDQVEATKNQITTSIQDAIQSVIPTLGDIIGGLVELLRQKIDELLQNIATVEDFVQTAISVIRQHAPELQAWLTVGGGLAFKGIIGSVLEGLEGDIPGGAEAALTAIENGPGVPAFIKAIAQASHKHTHPVNFFILIGLCIVSLIPFIGGMAEPGREAMLQVAWSALPVRLLDVGATAEAVNRGQIDRDTYLTEAKRQGYDAGQAQRILDLREEFLGAAELHALKERGEITPEAYVSGMGRLGFRGLSPELYEKAHAPLWPTEDLREGLLRQMLAEGEHDKRLGAYGFTAEQIALRKSLYHFIPAAPDLTRMADKYLFAPAIDPRFGQFAEMQDGYSQAMAMLGYDPEWTKLYWASHWELPSPQQVFEMFHRGVITQEEMSVYLHLTDWLPFFRDKLTAISYETLTRVDVRRMHKVGVLTREQVKASYKVLGYDEEKAEWLTEFTVRTNSKENDLEIEPFRAGLKTRIVTAYIDGTLTAGDAQSLLEGLGYTPGQAEAFTAEAIFARTSDRLQAIRAGVKKLYIAGRVNWDAASTRLGSAGIGEEERANLKEAWDIDLEYRELSDAEKEQRDLTKSEILTAYKDNVIKSGDATSLLSALGYDAREVTILIAVADQQALKAVQTAQRNAIKAEFMRAVITEEQASLKLDAQGYTADYRDGLLAQWAAEKVQTGAKVPVATIRDLLNQEIIAEARARELLDAYNYPEDVREGVLTLWKSKRSLGGQANATVA